MGLIKAIGEAIGSTMRDQWLDLIKCDNMGMETLMVKKTTEQMEKDFAYEALANWLKNHGPECW